MLALRADPAGIRELALPVLLATRLPGAYRHLPALATYLRTAAPTALISAFPFENLLATAARRLAGGRTRVIVTERNTTTRSTRAGVKWKRRFLGPLLRRQYATADAVVAVSSGVADALAKATGLPRERIAVVHNPVVDSTLEAMATESVAHPWLAASEPPVVLGVGRLVEQKGFATLIRAVAEASRTRQLRLIILGSGSEATRRSLLELADGLGCGDAVELPGFMHNPFAWMARADVFVLSSLHEGLPAVLIQALACGCPVVSTDCPSGPSEILEGGRYGRLVPVGDHQAMAAAILSTLAAPDDRLARISRAATFSVERAARAYLQLASGSLPDT
jgi:glycosyltransferase involved in cell wall biosynthesis